MTTINIGPNATYLPAEPDVVAAINTQDPQTVARSFPASPLAWATLAEQAWTEGKELESYAYARVGYHRGLDALRKAGWRGSGAVPASHEPNLGFLRCLAALGRAAGAINEEAEVTRIAEFLSACDPSFSSES